MKPSPVAMLRAQKKDLEAMLVKASEDDDVSVIKRLTEAIEKVNNYLKSWGAVVR